MIRPALALAERTDAVYFVADYHAMTTTRDPVRLRAQSREVAATWLALGFDADRSVLYRQSDLPEVCELVWILSCVTPKGLLNRAHAYKAAVQDNAGAGRDDDAGVSMGLFNYPLLMAADILIHRRRRRAGGARPAAARRDHPRHRAGVQRAVRRGVRGTRGADRRARS